jgi:hypothetical protein
VPTIAPPRDVQVAADVQTVLAAANTSFGNLAETFTFNPASLAEGLQLVAQVAGVAAPAGASQVQQPLVAADPTLLQQLVNAFLTTGFVGVAHVLVSSVIPSPIVDAFFTTGFVGVAQVLVSSVIPSPIVTAFFTNGIIGAVGAALVAASDAIFGPTSFPTGLTNAFFFGYPTVNPSPGLVGAAHFIIDSLIGGVQQPAAVQKTLAAAATPQTAGPGLFQSNATTNAPSSTVDLTTLPHIEAVKKPVSGASVAGAAGAGAAGAGAKGADAGTDVIKNGNKVEPIVTVGNTPGAGGSGHFNPLKTLGDAIKSITGGGTSAGTTAGGADHGAKGSGS